MKTCCIEVTIWDNNTTKDEKQDALLWAEHALNKTVDGYGTVKYYRCWCGFTATITYNDWILDGYSLFRGFNRRLYKLHYFAREDEPIVLEYSEGH